MKFREYLSSLSSILQKVNPKKYVIGNSSADFDSIFGSLIYAFFLTSQLGEPYLPIIDCNKTDIPLRFDVSFILKKLQIDYHHLLYSSDINYFEKESSFCLYDHNQRQQVSVSQIIDHHAFHETQKSPLPQNRIIFPAGSALTLLYYLFNPKLLSPQDKNFQLAFEPYLSKNVQKEIVSEQIIDQIIRHGVLIDSFGFDENQRDRWTQADKFVVQNIQKSQKFEFTYEDLSDLKFNDEMNLALTLEEHLRRDYKLYEYKTLGKVQYAVVCLDPDLFLEKYGQNVIEKFSYAEYETYMIMFIWMKAPASSTKPALFGRQAIFSINSQIQEDRRVQILQRIQNVFKKLGLMENISFQNWNRWNDPTATVSRKKVDRQFKAEPPNNEL